MWENSKNYKSARRNGDRSLSEQVMNLFEAAAYLKISPTVLEKLTRFCPKYNEDKKLPVAKTEKNILYFRKSDLDEHDRYLRSPWPVKVGEKRPSTPDYLVFAIKQESEFHCALCQWTDSLEIAHIEPWATSRNHHPHNLLAACPNHHTQYDVKPTTTLSMLDIKRIKKEQLQRLQAKQIFATGDCSLVQKVNEHDKKFKDLEAQIMLILEQRVMEPKQSILENGIEASCPAGLDSTVENSNSVDDFHVQSKAMESIKPEYQPQFWETDQLTKFLADAHSNIQKMFFNEPELTQRIIDLAELTFYIIRTFTKRPERLEEIFANLFFMRAHSSLLAAIRLGLSGQFPEAHSMLKGALIHCLYLVSLGSSADNILVFLLQNNSDRERARAKSLFKRSMLLKTLAKKSAATEKYAKFLLNHAESFGAPGQSFELFSNIVFEADKKWTFMYMGNSEVHFKSCLKQIARTQICCLLMLETIYAEKFQALGINEKLATLMQDL